MRSDLDLNHSLFTLFRLINTIGKISLGQKNYKLNVLVIVFNEQYMQKIDWNCCEVTIYFIKKQSHSKMSHRIESNRVLMFLLIQKVSENRQQMLNILGHNNNNK